MSRLTGLFANLGKQGRAALIPFVTAGDPSLAVMVPLLHALVAAGADAIELGVPFSDPMADGPTIQRASERALARGVKMRMALEWVREFRLHNQHTPIILMGYLNPVEAMGVESFALAAKDAGVDGVILVDLPPEEGVDYAELLKNHQIDPIFLLAPTSGAERVAAVKAIGSGFVYYVSLRGITGAAQADWQEVLARVATRR
ncbi:MAG: tryptophan synthase subunit alpha, partial [Acidithiobacillus sp.]